jgi:hypothetical protein
MKALRLIKTRFFLKRHVPMPSTIELLENLYPGVQWERVEFYEGLPWFTAFIAPFVTAQALPHFYSFGKYKIYLLRFDESRAQCLADIVHEAFHVFQAMQFMNGYGIGFLRGLMIYYNALFLRFGYRMNPFEIPAYDQEFRFLDFCERHGYHGISPQLNREALEKISNEASLIHVTHPFKYSANYLFLAGSFVFCIIITILRPIFDILAYLVIQFVSQEKQLDRA